MRKWLCRLGRAAEIYHVWHQNAWLLYVLCAFAFAAGKQGEMKSRLAGNWKKIAQNRAPFQGGIDQFALIRVMVGQGDAPVGSFGFSMPRAIDLTHGLRPRRA